MAGRSVLRGGGGRRAPQNPPSEGSFPGFSSAGCWQEERPVPQLESCRDHEEHDLRGSSSGQLPQ